MANTGVDGTAIEAETEGGEPEVAAEVKPAKAKSSDSARMAKALASVQRERDEARAALVKAEDDAKRASMTEIDKAKADVAARTKEVDAARAEAAAAKAEAARERLVSRLVSKHKLADPEFGDLVLKGYKPEEHEDFDEFVETFKADPKYKVLFAAKVGEKITNDDGSDIVPAVGGPKAKTQSATSQDANDREFAEQQFPNNKARQDAYLNQLRKLRSNK